MPKDQPKRLGSKLGMGPNRLNPVVVVVVGVGVTVMVGFGV